ncbi:MAG: hypothetical protein NC344_09595 [Bacteroidales bacterium]|nr:hypothetical protein [Bacteroidales bacterium]MCM1148059.1 hypothetical protein [Bacteroidales bacterium]MCM1207170.1 hypothetical protein [Bacillota bacterium]MCM1509487.1 hypothetical protein [Clostridium sp.]
MIPYIGSIMLAVAMVVLYETQTILEGGLAGNVQGEFLAVTAMELITICAIPFALRLFKFRKIREIITEKKADGLFRMALVRMAMICLPMLINTLLYYLYMAPAFGYMAIVGFISMAFITPTVTRCESEA